LAKSDSIIEMLSKTLFAIMVDIYGNGVDEIFLNYVAFHQLVNDGACPFGRWSNIFANTSTDVGTGLS
jgi:hypothetical protein